MGFVDRDPTAAEMEHDAAYRAWIDGDCTARCPNGESRAAFCERTCAAFALLLKEAAAREKQTLTIVAHGGTMRAVMERVLRRRRRLQPVRAQLYPDASKRLQKRVAASSRKPFCAAEQSFAPLLSYSRDHLSTYFLRRSAQR